MNPLDIIILSAVAVLAIFLFLRFWYKEWFRQNDTCRWFTNVLIGFSTVVVCWTCPYSLPFVSSDEYFIDRNGVLHQDCCEYATLGKRWFTFKGDKYNVLLKANEELCTECFLYEWQKMMIIHMYNMYELYCRVRASETQEYAKKYMQKYKHVDYSLYMTIVRLLNNKKFSFYVEDEDEE